MSGCRLRSDRIALRWRTQSCDERLPNLRHVRVTKAKSGRKIHASGTDIVADEILPRPTSARLVGRKRAQRMEKWSHIHSTFAHRENNIVLLLAKRLVPH